MGTICTDNANGQGWESKCAMYCHVTKAKLNTGEGDETVNKTVNCKIRVNHLVYTKKYIGYDMNTLHDNYLCIHIMSVSSLISYIPYIYSIHSFSYMSYNILLISLILGGQFHAIYISTALYLIILDLGVLESG